MERSIIFSLASFFLCLVGLICMFLTLFMCWARNHHKGDDTTFENFLIYNGFCDKTMCTVNDYAGGMDYYGYNYRTQQPLYYVIYGFVWFFTVVYVFFTMYLFCALFHDAAHFSFINHIMKFNKFVLFAFIGVGVLTLVMPILGISASFTIGFEDDWYQSFYSRTMEFGGYLSIFSSLLLIASPVVGLFGFKNVEEEQGYAQYTQNEEDLVEE